MAITDDIVATWRAPRVFFGRLLAADVTEGRAAVFLIAALLLIFVALLPGLSRAAVIDARIPLSQRMLAALLGVLAAIPAFYALAAGSRIAARAFGGTGGYAAARIVLFWAMLAVSPVILLQGLVAGMIGPGPAMTLMSVVVFAAFLWIWGSGLWVAERRRTV
jgi:hypothetical protein